MDRTLIDRYFQDQCSDEELEQVLEWFETEEGQAFLHKDMQEEFEQATNRSDRFMQSDIESERLFNRIQLHKTQGSRIKLGAGIRVASILLIVATLSTVLYWGGYMATEDKNPQPETITYMTGQEQQNILTLSDGTHIRLNEESRLTVPAKLEGEKRNVNLKGEAYFEVARDTEHPFIVNTEGSTVEVLGTKFNVKTDSVQNSVEVAVIEGKVALKRRGAGDNGGALLTRNNFGLLRLSDGQITIEEINTKNYLSWVNNRLIYSGETLEQVSRQIEHLYNVEIAFKTEEHRKLKLTANIERTDLGEVLDIIANTFDISYQQKEEGKIIWLP